MAMDVKIHHEGFPTNQQLSNADSSQNLRLRIRSTKDTILIYSLKGKDTKSIPCEILKDEMLLLERNWTRLIESNDSKSCQNEHLCLYELWEDDTAEQVKINCNSSFVRGIVLVNDNGKVDDTFWQGKNDIDVPVCIVSKVSCEDLLDQVGPDSRVNKNSKGPKNSTGPIVKVSATEGVFEFASGAKKGNVAFNFPINQCSLYSQPMHCLPFIPDIENTVSGDRFLHIHQYKSEEELQAIGNKLAVNQMTSGIVVFNVPNVVLKKLHCWGFPPLYVIAAADGQMLLRLCEPLKTPVQVTPQSEFKDVHREVNPCQAASRNMVRVLPLKGELSSSWGKSDRRVEFHLFFPLDSTDVQFPPFAQTLQCVDAKEKTDLDPPYLAYYFLTRSETWKDVSFAVHKNEHSESCGVVVVNSTQSPTPERHFYEDKKAAKKFLVPMITIGFFPAVERFLKTGEVTLFLTEGRLIFGPVDKSPIIKICNPCGIDVSTRSMPLLFGNQVLSVGIEHLRLLYHSEGMTYSTMIQDVVKCYDSTSLAGIVITSCTDDNRGSKDLTLPRGFFQIAQDSKLPQLPIIAIAHSAAKRLMIAIQSGAVTPNDDKDQNSSVFSKGITYVKGMARKLWGSSPEDIRLCSVLKSIDWSNGSAISVYDKIVQKVKDWDGVVDKEEAVMFLKDILESTRLKHLPIHILVAWHVRKTDAKHKEYLQNIYLTARKESSERIIESMNSYRDVVQSQQKSVSCLLKATEEFIKSSVDPTVQAFWITLNLCGMKAEKASKEQWTVLYHKDPSNFLKTEKDIATLQKWIIVGQHVGIRLECQFNLQNLSELLAKSSRLTFSLLRIVVVQFQSSLLRSPGCVHNLLKSVRSKAYEKLPFKADLIEEGAKFIHDTVMIAYCTGDKPESGLVNELKLWWRELVKKFDLQHPKETIECFGIVQSTLKSDKCAHLSEEMMAAAENELTLMMQRDPFMNSVTLKDFDALCCRMHCFPKEVMMKFFGLPRLATKRDLLTTDSFVLLSNHALQRCNDIDMSKALSTLILNTVKGGTDSSHQVSVLLHLEIPLLFSPDVKGVSTVRQTFKNSLMKKIETQGLRKVVQTCFLEWLEGDTYLKSPFQQWVLEAMLPSLNMLELELKEIEKYPDRFQSYKCLGVMMKKLALHYDSPDHYLVEDPVYPYNVFWRIIETTVNFIVPRPGFEWCQKFKNVIKVLSLLYSKAHELHQLEAPLWRRYQPAIQYLVWIKGLSRQIEAVQKKINSGEWTQEFLEGYQSSETSVAEVATCLHISAPIASSANLLHGLRGARLQIVSTLLKQSDNGTWISLLTILDRFTISLEDNVMKSLSTIVNPALLKAFDGQSIEKKDVTKDLLPKFSRSATMVSLKVAVETVLKAFESLDNSMKALLFFTSKKGRLFERHLRLCLSSKRARTLPDFAGSLDETVAFLHSITEQQVGYKQLKTLQFFQLSEVQKQSEIELLRGFHKIEQKGDDFLSAFKDMTDFVTIVDMIPQIEDVCRMCDLKKCLEDDDLAYLVEIKENYGTDEAKDALNSQLASDAMKQIRPILPLNCQQLELFAQIAANRDFYQFIKEIEIQGKERFRSLYSLITSMLQHEEYNDEVLNQLPIAREYVLPFLDREQNFRSLMERVDSVSKKARGNFQQMEVMKNNINLVRRWFSKAEDNTLESVIQDLNSVMMKGMFCISSQIGMCCDGLSTCQVSTVDEREHVGKRAIISEEWIDDFNRRLGLLEKKQMDRGQNTSEDSSETLLRKMELFQQTYKHAKKISSLWIEMKSLGCPYIEKEIEVECKAVSEDLNDIHSDLAEHLLNWKISLADLRANFKELLLFTIPKVDFIFQAIQKKDHELILKEVAHASLSRKKTTEELKQHVAMALCVPDVTKAEYVSTSSDSSDNFDCGPFKVVGTYLRAVSVGIFLEEQKYSTQKVVHILPGRSQKEALNLLFSVYGRIPHSFEVYHCRRSTTDKELQLIYERAKAFKMTVCILNVNMLSLRLQEILLKLHRQSLSDNSEFGIHYMASGASIIQDLPQVEVRKVTAVDDFAMKGQWEELCKAYKEMLVRDKMLKSLELVYGQPGDGKSHYIRKKMSGFDHSAILTFDESFSVEEAIMKLRLLPLEKSSVIYFNFTLLPANESSSPRDREAYRNLVTKIQWFLFDLFFLGYVEDVSSGLSFSFVSGLLWSVYVEIPSQEVHQQDIESHTLAEVKNDPSRSLDEFLKDFPVLALVGKPKHIGPEIPLDIDDDTQLVCKYLKAFCRRNDRRTGIDRQFHGHAQEKVSFAKMPNVTVRECHRLLKLYTPENARVNKMYQMIFVKYMARRCRFLEKCPSYNYNTYDMDERGEPKPFVLLNEDNEEIAIDTSSLGSALFKTMLQEVNDFCSQRRRSNWEGDARQQLVYVLDGIDHDGEEGGSFEVIALKPDEIPSEEQELFKKIQISVLNRDDLETRDVLDRYIASAFGLNLTEGRLVEIDKKNYVLTLDFALKMLEINERYWARIPVIIEGETGVGKTFLVEMMADLWNGSLMHRWNRIVVKLWTLLQKLALAIIYNVTDGDDQDYSDRDGFISALGVLKSSCDRLEQDIMAKVDENVAELIPQGGATLKMMTSMLQCAADYHIGSDLLDQELQKLVEKQPLIHLLKVPAVDPGNKSAKTSNKHWASLDTLILKPTGDPQSTAENLFKLLMEAEVDVFHRISIHASLTTEDMRNFFTPIISQAKKVEQKWINPSTCPSIIVFLDETNTSSCPGLMKEILVDRSLHGEKLPKSIFVIGACNPHRGHSVVMHEKLEDAKKWEWVKGSYYVHRMHQSVRYLLWDYGALDERQEKNYIEAKMTMLIGSNATDKGYSDDESGFLLMNSDALGEYHYNDESDSLLMEILSDKVAESQQLMRKYADEHYLESKMFTKTEAEELSKSCVSQRDIQRVFTFFTWLLKTYDKFRDKVVPNHPATKESHEEWKERAVMVSLGLTYYFRLSTEYREKYQTAMDFNIVRSKTLTFSEALKNEMDFYCDIVHLPPGIAKTQALKENLFCVVACCCTKMPLIIVGEPGSSKTLSFNIAASNFKGSDSKQELLKDTDLFPCFDPHYYQCSRTTTSKEVEVVFQRALKRQEAVSKHQYENFQNVVFMDEAGLPEESLESLKVLHKYLDNPQVSFVGITNHILDAAKTNRTVTLFRPRADKDVQELAHGCLGITKSTEEHIGDVINRLCICYNDLMSREESFKRFFGLRDFIHFMNYLRRQTDRNIALLGREDFLIAQVTRSVERNFNGHKEMEIVRSSFSLKDVHSGHKWRNIIEVLHESLADKPRPIFIDDQEDFEEVRYKLIIDPTEDDSSRRLMMMFEILKPQQTTTVIGSDFSDDGYLQNIDAVSKITNAASSGATVLMLQTDEIHESFYDLFNQHFRKIKVGTQKGEKQTHFFANVAIGSHSKPCRVNHEFQCIVIIKDSELAVTPAPFLNRFEKYKLSTSCFIEASLCHLPPFLRKSVEDARDITWLPKDAMASRRSQPKPFVNLLGESSFFGLTGEDTINSLFLIILPKSEFVHSSLALEPLSEEWMEQPITDVITCLLMLVLKALENSGFCFSMSEEDITKDASILNDMLTGQQSIVSENVLSNHELFDAISEAWSIFISEEDLVGKKPPSVTFLQKFVKTWIHIWVVRRLLQLLTHEAFILHKRTFQKKYPWCLKEYLVQQHQLDLTRPIKDQGPHCSSEANVSKLVCLTRSFQAFSKLTSQADDESSSKEEGHVQLCMLSAISSQQEFSDKLLSFTESTEKAVLIILANMFEASKKLINYVRLRIDEVDEGWQGTHQKTFVVLLYFPTSVSQIYPAMFFYGWDFRYLDSLDLQKSTEYTAQLNHWCTFAYMTPSTESPFRKSSSSHLQRSYSLSKTCHGLLEDCASVLSARITLHQKDGMVLSNKQKKVMFKNLLRSNLGEKLVSMYLEYWSMSPSKVARVLHGIAVFSKQLKSLHSITDLFQSLFESTFHNFMAYMIHHINEELDLSTFDEETCELFLTLVVEMVERPKSLASIKGYSNTWGVRQTAPGERVKFTFPGFNKVCSLLEDRMESYVRGARHLQGGDHIDYALFMSQCEDSDVLRHVLSYIDGDDNLWRLYQNDLCSRLHFSKEDMEIIRHFMASRRSTDETNVVQLIDLHYIAYTNPLDLSYLRKLMKPLLSIQSAFSQPLTMTSIIECVLRSVNSGHAHNEELAEVIVVSLERYLSESNGDKKMLEQWQNDFNNVCTEKELEVALYSSGKSLDPMYRSRFLCVKSVFILMQSHSAPDEEFCKSVWIFHKLIQEEQKHCEGSTLRLGNILNIIHSKPETGFFRRPSDNILPVFLPELLQHVFHPSLPAFDDAEVMAFLEYVSKLPFSATQGTDVTIPVKALDYIMLLILTAGLAPEEKDCDTYGMSTRRRMLVGQVLTEKGPATNYLPPFMKGSGDRLLAHLYYFSMISLIEKQTADRQNKIFDFIHAISAIKGAHDEVEESLSLIERQVYIFLLIAQVSSDLSDVKKVPKIEKNKDKIFSKVLCRAGNTMECYELFSVLLQSLVKESEITRVMKKVAEWLKVANEEQKGSEAAIKSEMIPHFWRKDDILQVLHQSKNVYTQLLCRLLDNHKRLVMEMKFLPIIVEFCSNLKSLLDFKVDGTTAKQLDMKAAIERACDEVKSSDKRGKILQLLRDFIEYFNEWRGGKTTIVEITGETPLEAVLLAGSREECLTVQVLNSIIKSHNSLLNKAYECSMKSPHLIKWLSKPAPIEIHELQNLKHLFCKPPTEVHLLDCMRQCLPVMGRSTDDGCVERMCNAVIREFLVGTPTIQLPSADTIQDMFALNMKSGERQSNFVLNAELAAVREQMKGCFQNFKEPFPKKDILAHFHSADHSLLEGIVKGLLLVAHYLTQEKSPEDWTYKTLDTFVKHVEESWSLAHLINMTRSTDLRVLDNLKVGFLECVLELFVKWMETGFCDYHSLPLGAKKDPEPLESSCDVFAILQEEAKEIEQRENLCRLEDIILPDAMGLTMGDFEMSVFEKPLREYVTSVRLLKTTSPLLKLIPAHLQLKHYVYFMIQLRRVNVDHQNTNMSSSTTDVDESSADEETESDPLNLSAIFTKDPPASDYCLKNEEETLEESDVSDEENTPVDENCSMPSGTTTSDDYTSAEEGQESQSHVNLEESMEEKLEDQLSEKSEESHTAMDESTALLFSVYGNSDESEDETSFIDAEEKEHNEVSDVKSTNDVQISQSELTMENVGNLSHGSSTTAKESVSESVVIDVEMQENEYHSANASQQLFQATQLYGEQPTPCFRQPQDSLLTIQERTPDPLGGQQQVSEGFTQPLGEIQGPHESPRQPFRVPQEPYEGPPISFEGQEQLQRIVTQPSGAYQYPQSSHLFAGPHRPHLGTSQLFGGPQLHRDPSKPIVGPQSHEGPSQPIGGPQSPKGPYQPIIGPQSHEDPSQPIGGPQSHKGPSQSIIGRQSHEGPSQLFGGPQLPQPQGPLEEPGVFQESHEIPQPAMFQHFSAYHGPYPQDHSPYQPGYPAYPPYYGYQQSGIMYSSVPRGYVQQYGHPTPNLGYSQSPQGGIYCQPLTHDPSSLSSLSSESEGSKKGSGKASEKAKRMTTAEVVQWLGENGLGEYKELFKEEDVDGSLLADLDSGDLEAMGMVNPFHRKKLLKKFNQI